VKKTAEDVTLFALFASFHAFHASAETLPPRGCGDDCP
jgi:hypothetical protein